MPALRLTPQNKLFKLDLNGIQVCSSPTACSRAVVVVVVVAVVVLAVAVAVAVVVVGAPFATATGATVVLVVLVFEARVPAAASPSFAEERETTPCSYRSKRPCLFKSRHLQNRGNAHSNTLCWICLLSKDKHET